MTNPTTRIDPLGLNEVCPEAEANLVLKETQSAKKLGVDLNNNTNGTAKTEIKITSEINYSDVSY